MMSPFHKVDYTLGWKYKENLKDFEYLYVPDIYLTTNQQGYRNFFDFSVNDEKPIFMLGDSFTFGEEVSDKETYTYLLSKKFSDKKFYNFGINGYGYDQMFLTLERYIGIYKPEMVILSFNFTDLDRAMLSFFEYFKPYYTLYDNELILHTDHILNEQDTLDQEKYNLKLSEFLTILYTKLFPRHELYKKTKILLNEKIIEKMVKIIEQHNSKLVLFYLPIAKEPNNLSDELMPYEKLMFDYCKKFHLECYSTRDEFKKYVKDSGKKFKEKGHWRQEGHKAVFRSMAKIIK